MTADRAALAGLADLLAYPRTDLAARAAECAERLAPSRPAAAARLARFAAWALGAGPDAPGDAYTAAFNLAPVCTPYVGDHLFGAGPERSHLLAGLAELRRQVGLPAPAELADHVSEVLRLATAAIPEDVRDDLVADGLAPTLRKMLAALDAAAHPWADAVAAVLAAVEPLPAPPPDDAEARAPAQVAP